MPITASASTASDRDHAATALLAGLIVLVLIAVLIGVGIVRIGRLALIVLRAAFDLAVQRLVVARRIELACGFVVWLLVGEVVLQAL